MTSLTQGAMWRRIAGPLFLFRAIGQGLEFLGWVILARRLGASTLGVLSMAFLIARYAGLLADWGASIGGPRDVARDDVARTRSRALVTHRRNLTVGLVVAFVMGCVLSGHPEMAPVASVIAMLGLSRDWIAVGEHRGARAALPLLVQGAFLFVIAGLFATKSTPAVAVSVGYGAAAVVSVLLNRLPPRPVVPVGSEHPKVPLQPWMLGAVMTNQILSSSDVLLLGVLGTTTATGVYSAVYRIPNGWLAGVSILAGALLPVAAAVSHDLSRFHSLRRGAFRVSVVAALLLVAVTPIVFFLIPRVFGQQFASGQWPAVVLMGATAVATAASPLHQFYLTTGNDRRYAGFLALSAGTIITSGLLLIPMYSMVGAAFSTLIAHVVLASVLAFAVFGSDQDRRQEERQTT